MASIKQNDVQMTNNSINPEILKGQPLNLNQVKMDSTNITNENDRNSNLSPSKSADPARKKTFKIISVKKGGSGSGDLPGDNDGDSIDGLDESQTEDLSSEFYDSSKATDLDMDLPDSMMPLTPDEVTSTTTIVVKQKPDRDSQSRFKVVKIETKEPFRRGKWVCYDYFDTTPASVVTLEKNGSKMTEDSILQSALSGNLSSSSSVHYVQDVNDSSSMSNIYVTPFVPISPTGADGQHLFSDVFVPIPLAPPASQVLNPGLSSADVTPFIAQQVFMSMAGVPSSSTSFYSVAQPGQTTIIQSVPPSNVFPYAQNGPSASLYQNGVAGQTNVLVNLPPDPIIATASVIPPVIPPMQPISVADITAVNQDHGPGFVIVGGIPVPRSQSQTQISGVPVVSQVLQPVIENCQSLPAVGISNATNVTYSSAETASAFSGLEVDQMGPGMDESTGSIKTLQGDPEADPPQGLEEAVEAIHTGLEGNDEDADESGGSTVAIDNKIEQAMDLVKRHLMYAVREEVEILKQQIGEMMERIGQLEYENTVLRAEAKPETLNKLLLPRVTQTQPTSALPAPTSAAPAPQQGQQATNTQAPSNHNAQNATPQSQTQIHVQQPAQPAPQQQVQSTPASQATHAPQAGHPPST